MRPFLSVLLVIALSASSFPQAMPTSGLPQTVPASDRIPLVTPVEIELLENISSETLHAGQSVAFKLSQDLEANGEKLLPAGTPLTGTVATANASGHWGKAGAFDLKLEPLKLGDGTLIRLDFHRPTRVSTHAEKTVESVGTAMVMTYYFPLIPVALLAGSRKGKPFKVRAGERYRVYVVGVEEPAKATDSPKP
ncbi:MAG TPA: hypothetical protein VK466_16785 [Terriglobales bacterium]|nr:hypothetical protein [Terriglobales bacterium]